LSDSALSPRNKRKKKREKRKKTREKRKKRRQSDSPKKLIKKSDSPQMKRKDSEKYLGAIKDVGMKNERSENNCKDMKKCKAGRSL